MRISDWSSDVCSSDLTRGDAAACEGPERPDLVGGSPPLALPGLDLGRGDGGIAPGKRELFLLRPVGLQLVERPLQVVQHLAALEIGRASCRERVCQYV